MSAYSAGSQELRERLRNRRTALLHTYVQRLRQEGSPLCQLSEEQLLEVATPLFDAAISTNSPIEAADQALLVAAGEQRATRGIPPEASTKAAHTLFAVVREEVVRSAAEAGASIEDASIVLQRLNRLLLQRLMRAATPYASELLRQISVAHHNERRRIARDLHDHIAHALAICMQQMELRGIAMESGDAQEADRRLDLLHDSLKEASHVVHELSLELGQFQTGRGFVSALERFIDLRGTDRVSVSASQLDAIEAAPPWILEEFFIAVREGIQNSLTHSGSDEIRVAVGTLGDEIRATVEDKGKGLDVQLIKGQSSGKGLVSLRERVEILGGRVRLTSTPGVGTLLDLRVPLDR